MLCLRLGIEKEKRNMKSVRRNIKKKKKCLEISEISEFVNIKIQLFSIIFLLSLTVQDISIAPLARKNVRLCFPSSYTIECGIVGSLLFIAVFAKAYSTGTAEKQNTPAIREISWIISVESCKRRRLLVVTLPTEISSRRDETRRDEN